MLKNIQVYFQNFIKPFRKALMKNIAKGLDNKQKEKKII